MKPHAALKARFLRKGQHYAQLRRKLLALGGEEVVLIPDNYTDADMHGDVLTKRLVLRGKVFDGPRDFVALEPHGCHSNALLLYQQSKGRVQWATGYALSGGLWRQHSWGLGLKSGETVETIIETTEHRLKYWGIVLTATDAARVVKRLTIKE